MRWLVTLLVVGAFWQPLSPITDNTAWEPVTEAFDGVEMVLVPPGCFMVGSETGEGDEKPLGEYCFEAPFYIDRYEVSNAQFKQFAGQAAEESRWIDPTHPRERVTWFEALAFCQKRDARLPTEVEWEYAARGPSGYEYPWGNVFDPLHTVYIENSHSQTAPVGSHPEGASWVGALDMSGNVAEWVSTVYDVIAFPYPYQPDDGREDLTDITSRRGLRGGSFLRPWQDVRGANRDGAYPDYWNADFGWRCARDSE